MQRESPYKLAPGVRAAGEDEADESSESEDEESGLAAPGSVFRLARGQLRKLDGGMDEYEDIAARTAARLAKARR